MNFPWYVFGCAIYSSLFIPLPILLILSNPTLKDENPKAVTHYVRIPIFPHPTQTPLPTYHLLTQLSTAVFLQQSGQGRMPLKGNPWASNSNLLHIVCSDQNQTQRPFLVSCCSFVQTFPCIYLPCSDPQGLNVSCSVAFLIDFKPKNEWFPFLLLCTLVYMPIFNSILGCKAFIRKDQLTVFVSSATSDGKEVQCRK